MLAQNVYEAAIQRLLLLYEDDHTVVVSYSAGKDSTVCLELAILAARETGRLPVHVVMRDEEIMLPGTYELAERTAQRPEVDFHWLIAGQPVINCFNRVMPYFWVFDDRCPELWVRQPPAFAEWIPEQNIQAIASEKRFPVKEGKLLIDVIGLRTEESPNRNLGLHSSGGYLTKQDRWGRVKCRPIYDWKVGDVWRAIHLNGWDYNTAYDVMHRHGISKQHMRISPPTLTIAGAEELMVAFRAFPQWADKVAKRLPGTRSVASFGKAALRPIRRSTETWEACYQRVCIDEAPQWIAERANVVRDKLLKQYARHNSGAFPEVMPIHAHGLGLVGSWKKLAEIMFLGDPFAQKTGKYVPYVEPEFFRKDLPEHKKKWGGTPQW